VSGGGEGAGVADGQEYRRCGLDADSRHGHQDLGKREVIEEFFDFFGNDGALVSEFLDLRCDAGDDEFDGFGADHGYGLLAQCGKDRVDQVHRVLAAVVSGPAQHVSTPGGPQTGGPGVLDEQLQDQGTGQYGSREDTFQGRKNLQQQGAQAVDRACALVGQIGVESGEDLQRREHLAVPVNGTQCVRHRACGLSDDERISRVRLGLSGIQVGGFAHCQAGQVGHRAAAVTATAIGSAPMVLG
jgi:hypothetical protein